MSTLASLISYRVCTKPWTIPDTDITIPKGMLVFIPVLGFHTDEQYFDEPNVFNPERFSPENKSSIQAGTFIPFGIGPRQCIGMRIARLEAKVMIYQLLRHFRLEKGEKTKDPIVWDKNGFNKIEGGNWIKLIPRN